MPAILVQETASLRLDEIFRYTRERWGAAQAGTYINGLFAAFGKIESNGVASKPVPAEFGIDGYFFRHKRHFVYWRRLAGGEIEIVTILHERMHLIDRFREEFGPI